jgi:hypothetical protein
MLCDCREPTGELFGTTIAPLIAGNSSIQRRRGPTSIGTGLRGWRGIMIARQPSIANWIHIIQSEYQESPGLRLTKPQVQRLWNLDSLVCEALLDALVDVQFLRRTNAGAYVRADSAVN